MRRSCHFPLVIASTLRVLLVIGAPDWTAEKAMLPYLIETIGGCDGRWATNTAIVEIPHVRGLHRRYEHPRCHACDTWVAPVRHSKLQRPVAGRSKANEQCSTLFGDRWTTRSPRIGPVPRHHPALPTQQCRRRDHKHWPVDARQQVAGRRQEPSAGRNRSETSCRIRCRATETTDRTTASPHGKATILRKSN